MSKTTPNLAKLIGRDLITTGRFPLGMLLLIFASAMGVVFMTHHTREAVTEKDQALVERERLDNEWRNLLLEETALAEHSRVQAVAKQELEMKRPDSDKEVVIDLP
ncbi:cell division protein FtsL [Vibrio scophthalmi]|uniref:Cell division protein FtsL n=2 Tax=Vibrio scophthalmi TaxID=45658 RepID=A0A1B1NS58_9VIBR|nr:MULTISPECIES: cell division protein FtsL [Vibrio]ANS86324.1 Cell division protein FtsL [Vibrio scophthalmi]ANU35507.1 Cell division protein FtsL [Vibrio scophthalmi]EGU29951.1 cell division protein FtsL [Vibrio sp. N418]EGU38909.1 cell division protein FtsL [Vibrio scophthalmi LMG 19158]MCY9805113.1 cell division protein FtsL [Vibrio scophthalmi]